MSEGDAEPCDAPSDGCGSPIWCCGAALMKPEFTLSVMVLIAAWRAPSPSRVTFADGSSVLAGSTCKDDGVRSDWIGVDIVGIRAAQEQGARLQCRFEFVETLLEFPLLLRSFAGLQETRAGCGRFFRAGLIVRASRDR
jgi:hypothetical protein